jgi:hypothetical protein
VTNENCLISKGSANGVLHVALFGLWTFSTVHCCKNSPDFWKLDLFSGKEIGRTYSLGSDRTILSHWTSCGFTQMWNLVSCPKGRTDWGCLNTSCWGEFHT